MATRLAESLMRYGKFELDDIGLRYLDWWKNGAFDTGPVAAQVLELVDSGISFADASETVHAETAGFTAGSNPAHRISPVAMLHALPDSELPQVAKAEADLTHRHPLAGDVSAAVACLCRALIRGHDWPAACNEARNGRMQETIHALEDQSLDRLKRGGFAPDALAAAVHFVQQGDCFGDALADALQFAGPANYCPVLVGAIGGARWGASAIPSDATLHLGELRSFVEDLALELAKPWGTMDEPHDMV